MACGLKTTHLLLCFWNSKSMDLMKYYKKLFSNYPKILCQCINSIPQKFYVFMILILSGFALSASPRCYEHTVSWWVTWTVRRRRATVRPCTRDLGAVPRKGTFICCVRQTLLLTWLVGLSLNSLEGRMWYNIWCLSNSLKIYIFL